MYIPLHAVIIDMGRTDNKQFDLLYSKESKICHVKLYFWIAAAS